ncbi:hypothetical protein [Dolichospermum circinale]|uniref:hypothetical protein n=1 Tax=Dolichospermum circinale TaxID=109265 RepID=UPI00232FB57B|nr:hypothetical protein [Dolichospermum circinale]MDB9456107.1 hypothetical protein [Dolichospermum circinale CS-541/06]MDB9463335.1 hypothetical protein [Dolichospermum circinale CS-541/04]MDB9549854.1 hypothetical protein [Dolichospermum circinale CS-1031]
MPTIFSTRKLLGIILIGLTVTSCGGGTSSNTEGTSSNTNPKTLTINVPSLGYSATLDKTTTSADIGRVRTELREQCKNIFNIGSRSQARCLSEVADAAQAAILFINN